MTILLDTNICLYLIKKQPPAVIERFYTFPVGTIGISTITLAELDYGVAKSRYHARNRTALEQFIAPLMVADFDREAARVWTNSCFA